MPEVRDTPLPPRRLPVGAEIQSAGGVHFRVWAPRRRQVTLVIQDVASGQSLDEVPLAAEPEGYFSGTSSKAKAGSRYGFRLEDDPQLYPDPASRWQPDGPHALSEVVDPAAFAWTDKGWKGRPLKGQVIYELHIGTFSPEGNWDGAIGKLPELADLGVTMVEVLPVAEFAGEFGWGYDGVDLYAPTRNYGTPDDFRRFVDEAHKLGMGVMLDVVYNHFGPVGNYLGQYSSDYLVADSHTGWGEAINFDSDNSKPVREYFASNAGYWIDEYHVDGLRLDAIHAIVDDSPRHILMDIGQAVREKSGDRHTLVILENEHQQGYALRPVERGGYGMHAGWNDDFHHVARVAATGNRAHYLGDYQGSPQEFISLAKRGHLFQGQWNERQQCFRGTPAGDLEAPQFVNFIQNHDQVGNPPGALRLHQLTSPGINRALTAFLMLAPGTPLLFQGQEFASSSPFHFFADHDEDLNKLVRKGRSEEMEQFRVQAGQDGCSWFADPGSRETFEACRLDWDERKKNADTLALHRDLLKLRREDPVFSAQRADRIEGAVLSEEAFLLRYFGEDGDDRLVLINLGPDLTRTSLAEPLVVPPDGRQWEPLWSSEEPRYGGLGTPPLDVKRWFAPGHSATVLAARPVK